METTAVTGSKWIIDLAMKHSKIVGILDRIGLVAILTVMVKRTAVRIVPAYDAIFVEKIGGAM